MHALKKTIASVESVDAELKAAPNDYEALVADADQPHPMQQELDTYINEFGESEECINELQFSQESLESLAFLLEQTSIEGGISDANLRMAQFAAGVSVHGIGLESVDISASLTASMEGIKERVSSIVKAIVSFIMRMVNAARTFFAKWLGGYAKIKKGIMAIDEELKTLQKDHELAGKYVSVTFRQGSALQIDGKVDAHTVVTGMHNTAAVAQYIYVIYPRLVKGIFGILEKMEIGMDFNSSSLNGSSAKFSEKDCEAMELLAGTLGKMYDDAYDGAEQARSVMPGGYRLTMEGDELQQKKENIFKRVFSALKTNALGNASSASMRAKVDHIKVATFGYAPPKFKKVDKSHADEIVKIEDINLGGVKMIVVALKTLIGFIDNKKIVIDAMIEEIERYRRSFEAFSKKYSNFLTSRSNSARADLQNHAFKVISNAIASPYLRPVLEFDSLVFKSMHASLILCRSVISAVKAEGKEKTTSQSSHGQLRLGYSPA